MDRIWFDIRNIQIKYEYFIDEINFEFKHRKRYFYIRNGQTYYIENEMDKYIIKIKLNVSKFRNNFIGEFVYSKVWNSIRCMRIIFFEKLWWTNLNRPKMLIWSILVSFNSDQEHILKESNQQQKKNEPRLSNNLFRIVWRKWQLIYCIFSQ